MSFFQCSSWLQLINSSVKSCKHKLSISSSVNSPGISCMYFWISSTVRAAFSCDIFDTKLDSFLLSFGGINKNLRTFNTAATDANTSSFPMWLCIVDIMISIWQIRAAVNVFLLFYQMSKPLPRSMWNQRRLYTETSRGSMHMSPRLQWRRFIQLLSCWRKFKFCSGAVFSLLTKLPPTSQEL